MRSATCVLILAAAAAVPAKAQLTWSKRGEPVHATTENLVTASFHFGQGFYDHARERVCFSPLREFDGQNVMQLNGTRPTALAATALAEEAGTGRVVLFGGANANVGGTPVNETWIWSPGTNGFTQVTPATPPLARAGAMMASIDYTPIGVVMFGGMGSGAVPLYDTWRWTGVDGRWSQLGASTPPPGRWHGKLVQARSDGALLLFGGATDALLLNCLDDAWLLAGNSWSNLTGTPRPPARYGHGMAYDKRRDRVVLFGGAAGLNNTFFGDTWEWSAAGWQQLTPANTPAARRPAAMVWDPVKGRVVMIGGYSVSGFPPVTTNYQDAWSWDGTNWTQMPIGDGSGQASEPSGRYFSSFAYDAAQTKLVLYGGYGGMTSGNLEDVWESNGRLWQQRSTGSLSAGPRAGAASTSARPNSTMAGVFVWGGLRTTLGMYPGNELWRWSGIPSQWTRIPLNAAVSPRTVATMGSIFANGERLVVFGGNPSVNADTDEFDVIDPVTGNTWIVPATTARPSARVSMAGATAPAGFYVFGGFRFNFGLLNDLWIAEYSTTVPAPFVRWRLLVPATPVMPSGRDNAALVHDPVTQRLYLFGGAERPNVLNDLWYFTDRWTQVNPPVSPPARGGHAMAYDPSISRIVLRGGFDGTGRILNDEWELDTQAGTWTQRFAPRQPAPRHSHAMVHDRANKKTFLFGGIARPGTIDLIAGDLWSYDGSQWTPIVGQGAAPAPRGYPVASFDEQLGVMVIAGGIGITALPQDTFHFDGTTWTKSPGFTPSLVTSAMAYDARSGNHIAFGSSIISQSATFRYNATTRTWTELTLSLVPPRRDHPAMAYDRVRQRIVLFGGSTPTAAPLNDTWEYDSSVAPNGAWTQVTVSNPPPARSEASMVFDESRGRVVMTGGRSSTTAFFADVWEWDGLTWTRRTPETNGPVATSSARMVFDLDRARIVMFGGRNVTNPLADLWELYAPIDIVGRGMPTRRLALDYYSQPVLGQTLRLGFANPTGIGLMLLDVGPVQPPPFLVLTPPLTCDLGNVYTRLSSILAVPNTAPVNFALPIPNRSQLHGYSVVFQAIAYQSQGCLDVSDALNVQLRR